MFIYSFGVILLYFLKAKEEMSLYFKKEVNAVFTANTSIDNIESSSTSVLNIVMRKEALKSAIQMKDRFNIPYVYI